MCSTYYWQTAFQPLGLYRCLLLRLALANILQYKQGNQKDNQQGNPNVTTVSNQLLYT
jgi:hypothetical protein